MKIIDEGVWWEFVCSLCRTKCQAEPEDARLLRHVHNEDGDEIGVICYVECGNCGQKNEVPAERLTLKIKEMAIEKNTVRY